MKITANGHSKFHFWGEHAQSFYLHFPDATDAALALPVLCQLQLTVKGTDACGRPMLPSSWQRNESLLGVFASGSDVSRVEAQLIALGADANAISSLARSVDRGEPFTVTFEVEDPAQILMALN
jgi:hypothetical protein